LKKSRIFPPEDIVYIDESGIDLLFWWSERERILLLIASNEKTPASIVVPDSCNRRKNGVRFTNRELLRTICSLAGWEDRISHRLTGKFVPELDMVAFRISHAI